MKYFDTSALVKRFVDEPGSRQVAALLAAEVPLATSKIAYAEFYAAIARRLRERQLSFNAHRNIARSFAADWRGYIRLDITQPLLQLTRTLVEHYPLRGFDAIHLASAVRLRIEIGESIDLVAADQRLLDAARNEGLGVVDVRG